MRLKIIYLLYLTICLALIESACSPADKRTTADAHFEQLSPAQSGIDFINQIENQPEFNIFRYRNFYNGGGVAIGDIDNDGLPDVYLTANQGPNKLFRNTGNFQFEDITEQAGVAGTRAWSTGVVMVDINHDDLLDIYVCNAGYVEGDSPENELFINQGDGTFVEQAANYGLDEDGYTTHTAFFDYDRDGDLDAYILNNSFLPVNTLNYSNKRELDADEWPVAPYLRGGGDKLLRNDEGQFVEVTDSAGIYSSLIGFGLGVAVGDVNGDHWPDLYISNDFFERDYLYINQQDGTFKEDIVNWMEHIGLFSMGSDIADINNDGFPEVFATDMLPDDDYRLKTTTVFENYNVYLLKQQRDFYHQYMHNTLQYNNQDGTFSEIAQYSGVDASDWSWGALLFDADNDGHRDIFVSNGILHDLTNQDFINFFANDVIQEMAVTGEKQEIQRIIDEMPSTPIPNRLFRNRGDLTFEEVAISWGLGQPSFSNGAAYGDLDNDGDLDLIVNNLNQPVMVFRNDGSNVDGNHYLQLQLRGSGNNTKAIGAKAYLYQDSILHYAELIPSRGFQSSVDYRLHFGLGEQTQIDSLVVIWPDQRRTSLQSLPVDTLLIVRQANATGMAAKQPLASTSIPTAPFREIPLQLPEHREDRFIDFFQEGLTMRTLSREGPKAAVADVNGDGRDDVFLGGASGFPAQLMIQQSDGRLEPSNITTFERDNYHEDTAAAFFDADGDGDPDLYVGSGGNLPQRDARYLVDRLYLNDGQGNFNRQSAALPNTFYNTSVIVPWDFDADGDLDLFVGSRSTPGVYGLTPPNFLLENNGQGQFQNVIQQRAPALEKIGMVTAALLEDVIGDNSPELLLVGEWMPPTLFGIQNGTIGPIPTTLQGHPGWWYAASAADLDGDGDTDFILGNRGENFYFSGSPEAPAKLWIADFDGSGSIEKIMTRSINGRDMPIPMKEELTTQLPELKKVVLKHEDYAKRSIQELFDPELLDLATVLEAINFQSVVAFNEGNGQFRLQALPPEVQFSCVCDIYCTDLNADDRPDLVMAGNDSGFMPQFSKLDASFGHVLINRSDGHFEWIDRRTSGFFVRGDVKQLAPIRLDGAPHLLVLRNQRRPAVFEVFANERAAN